jgi:CBS domain-containing protein
MLNEPVIEVATKDVCTITPETPISKAMGIMDKNNFQNLIVIDDENNINMVIMHDLLLATSLDEKVESLMFRPHCINQNTPFMDAVCEILSSGQRAAPIVDDEGKLVGIITDHDIMNRVATSKLLDEVKVNKLMSKSPITIDYNESIGKARSLMRKYDISRLVVLNKEAEPTGMITEEDILYKIYRPKRKMTVGDMAGDKVPRMVQPVSIIMNSPIISCDVDDSMTDAARLMEYHDVRGIPFLKNGTLRGMITRLDIMKYIQSLRKESVVEVELHGDFDEYMKELTERMLMTEVQKIAKYSKHLHWIKVVVKKEHDKGGVPNYTVKAYVKTPKKLYVAKGKQGTLKRIELDGDDIQLVSEKRRWDFIEVLKDSLESVKKQIEADKEKISSRHKEKVILEE